MSYARRLEFRFEKRFGIPVGEMEQENEYEIYIECGFGVCVTNYGTGNGFRSFNYSGI